VLASVTYLPLARESRYGRFTSIEAIEDPESLAVVARLMRALGWNGIANIDLIRSTEGTVFVLEVNPRCWGNMAAAVPLGVNFAAMLCEEAMDLPASHQACRVGRHFGVRDTLALLRVALTDSKVRRRLPWRRLLRESSLRTTLSDPIPEIAAVLRTGSVRRVASLIRDTWQRHAALVPEMR
jgi:predicted ATP-grasp superfamily ATP-dependent carboligase